MFWVLKRTMSLRWFFRVPATYVLVLEVRKLVFNYSLLFRGVRPDDILVKLIRPNCLYDKVQIQNDAREL